MHATTIGPNSVIQTINALQERFGWQRTRDLLSGCNAARWIDDPPGGLIDERYFRDLIATLVLRLDAAVANEIFRRSGRLTAEYVLANRLPRLVQRLVRALRNGPGPVVLLRAIGRNAATFGESGTYGFTTRPALCIELSNPVLSPTPAVAQGACQYNQGAFERLFEVLIDPSALLVQEHCQARGDATCTYRVVRGLPHVH